MHRGLASDPRQGQLPQFFLVVTPEVSDDVHHRLTVDLVVSADALHKFEIEQTTAETLRLVLTPPGAHHRTKAIGRTLIPAGFDEAEGVHRVCHRL